MTLLPLGCNETDVPSQTRQPLTHVFSTCQSNVRPSKGLQPQRLSMQSFVTVHGFRRTNVKSAQYPSRMKPLSFILYKRAGLWHISSTSRSRLSTPSSTKPSMAGKENCTIGIPLMALRQPPSFSERRWGAWSVATVRMRPFVRAFRKASLSALVLMAGLHLMRVPSVW